VVRSLSLVVVRSVKLVVVRSLELSIIVVWALEVRIVVVRALDGRLVVVRSLERVVVRAFYACRARLGALGEHGFGCLSTSERHAARHRGSSDGRECREADRDEECDRRGTHG
jgi:hypothetical protein